MVDYLDDLETEVIGLDPFSDDTDYQTLAEMPIDLSDIVTGE